MSGQKSIVTKFRVQSALSITSSQGFAVCCAAVEVHAGGGVLVDCGLAADECSGEAE